MACKLCGMCATYGALVAMVNEAPAPESPDPKMLHQGQWYSLPAFNATVLMCLRTVQAELGGNHVKIEDCKYTVPGQAAQNGHRIFLTGSAVQRMVHHWHMDKEAMRVGHIVWRAGRDDATHRWEAEGDRTDMPWLHSFLANIGILRGYA